MVHLVLVPRALGDLHDDGERVVDHARQSSGGGTPGSPGGRAIIPADPMAGRSLQDPIGVGPALERARLIRGLTLDEAARDTKLSVDQLTALEREDFEALPGDAFVRGALRTYAQYVGLSPDKVLAMYTRHVDEPRTAASSRQDGPGRTGDRCHADPRQPASAHRGGPVARSGCSCCSAWSRAITAPRRPPPSRPTSPAPVEPRAHDRCGPARAASGVRSRWGWTGSRRPTRWPRTKRCRSRLRTN